MENINYFTGRASEIYNMISEKKEELNNLRNLITIEVQKNFEEMWGLTVGDKFIIPICPLPNFIIKKDEIVFYEGFEWVHLGEHAMVVMKFSRLKEDSTANNEIERLYDWEEVMTFKKI